MKKLCNMDYIDDNVLLITSKYFAEQNTEILDFIKNKVKNIYIYSEVKPNPILKMVIDAKKILINKNCKKIIALGGGSVIDVAKAISIFYDVPNQDIWLYFNKLKNLDNIKYSIDLIAIPTTFATGSEYNKYCVITHKHEKRSISSNLLIPKMVYIEDKLLNSLSLSQKILGFFDCFMHIVECYISNKSSVKSKGISLLGIDLVLKNINDLKHVSNSDIVKLSKFSANVENMSSCISLHSLGHAISSLNSKILHGESILLIARNYFTCLENLKNSEILELNNYINKKSNFNSIVDMVTIFENIYFNLDKLSSNELLCSYFDLSKAEILSKAKEISCLKKDYFVNDSSKLSDENIMKCLEIDFVDVKKEISRFVNFKNIYFINSNCGISSYDVDIYCVVKGHGSETHCYYDKNGRWIEIFIDSLENINYKIKTIDALGINYASMLDFYYGNKKLYDKIFSQCLNIKNNYSLYKLDELLYTYRVQISFEKINSANHEYSNRMLCSALVYPFISFLLGKYHVFPSSPKNWLSQLESVMGNDFKDLDCLFDGKYDYNKIQKLIEKYTDKLEPINIIYEGKNRRSRVE